MNLHAGHSLCLSRRMLPSKAAGPRGGEDLGEAGRARMGAGAAGRRADQSMSMGDACAHSELMGYRKRT